MSLETSLENENVVRERAEAEGLSVNELLAHALASDESAKIVKSDPAASVKVLLVRWQAEEHTPVVPPVPTLPGETPTQALFRQWREEEAHRTDKEVEAEDCMWANIEQGLQRNERLLRLRTFCE